MMRTSPWLLVSLLLVSAWGGCTGPVRVPRDLGHVDCGAILDCNCVDGTVTELICASSCTSYCSSHGGVEPAGSCAKGEMLCQGLCRQPSSLATDPNNCGACNNVCTEYTGCVSGVCTVELSDGSFACRKDSDCGPGESCVLNLGVQLRRWASSARTPAPRRALPVPLARPPSTSVPTPRCRRASRRIIVRERVYLLRAACQLANSRLNSLMPRVA